jgi:CyaY protein
MTNSNFNTLLEKTYSSIESALEKQDIDCEYAHNVLTIELQHHPFIITPQSALSQLWLATKTQGFHFDFQANHWYCSKHQITLEALLSKELTKLAGKPIILEINLEQ